MIKLPRHCAQKSNLHAGLVSRAASPSLVTLYAQLVAVLLLLLLGQAVLGRGDLEFALAHERDETDTQVSTSEVEREELARLLAGGVLGAGRRRALAAMSSRKERLTHAKDPGRD